MGKGAMACAADGDVGSFEILSGGFADDLRASPVRKRANGNSDTVPNRVLDVQPQKRVVATTAANGRLLWWDEVPLQLQFNRYINSGYRANYTYGQCLCSIFGYHNETGNIWAHLLPLVAVIAVLVNFNRLHTHHHPYILSVLIPEGVCLLLSVTYHTFMAQVKHYKAWLKADVCGVFSVMMVPTFTVLSWGYRCHQVTRLVILSAYYACALMALITSATAKGIFWRALPMAMLALIRVGSLCHRFALGTSSPLALYHTFWGELMAAVGAYINVYRIPERWLPPRGRRVAGLLDYWGNSHFLMHLLAVGSMWHVYHAVLVEADYVLADPPCTPREAWW